MNKSDFFYNLPEELIAQHPMEPRDTSKLLVYDRHNKAIEDKIFHNIIDYLNPDDLLVLNNTKVIPARIYGIKEGTGARIELLLHKRVNYTDWEVLVKPSKRLSVGSRVLFPRNLAMIVLNDGEEGLKTVRFEFEGIFEDILSQIGEMPLPPYIKEKLSDKCKYQTVYAKNEGSSAAPTAGLHFTSELLKKIEKKGVQIAEVLLHVGLGTFRPVKTDDIKNHKMHSEFYEIDQANAAKINAAKREGRRIIAVGTTSVRVLESACGADGFLKAKSGFTEIFIYPPYDFKMLDALITNFHLPESTLIMLVSALCSRDETLKVYNHAVSHKYRFFSFGDAMFIK